jgi:TATA-box binding protein (TBP) (component of TFIID and TFIIIB)
MNSDHHSEYTKFDSIISENCKGKVDLIFNVSYTNISISTMTVCFNFNQSINLDQLKEKLSKYKIISYKPGSKKSKVPKKKGTDSFYNSFDIKLGIIDYTRTPIVHSNISIFIFPNGKVKIAGAKTIKTIYITIDEISELIGIPDLLPENIKIQMICSDFKIKPNIKNPEGWCLKQELLKNILVKNYSVSATFSALSRYPGINLKINSLVEKDKQISLLIFRSGSIIITGSKNAKDIVNCYSFIVNVISKYSKELFYFDINEEIKQKKKNKTN